ncbi:MAG: AmmeMemoRadiSam system protein A [Ignavibacteriaceae bacterium]
MELTDEEKAVLILAARDSIQTLFGEKMPPILDYNYFPGLGQVGPGAFVTLTIQNKLRGCIGYITSNLTLFDTVCDAAKQAATNDPRFYPLTEEELNNVNIEVSILSQLTPISSYQQIELGVHGLVLDTDFNRALLLPQVAAENNYNIQQFLTALCEKAGVDPYSWETKILDIKTFTATVFSEKGKRKRTHEQN